MTVYAESSAVLRWLFEEPRGTEVLGLLRKASRVVCSRLTLVECHRAVQRAIRTDRVQEVDSGTVLGILARAATRWTVIEVSADVATRAEARFPVEPVRTLDALHLASALALRATFPDLAVLTTDARIRENAARLGLAVLPD